MNSTARKNYSGQALNLLGIVAVLVAIAVDLFIGLIFKKWAPIRRT